MKTLAPTQTGPPAETDNFINERTFLERVPICRRTAKNYRDKGLLPAAQIGGRILYHWPTVRDALLRLQKGGAL